MSYENLLLEKQGSVAVLKVNRPKALNALNSRTIEELGAAVKELDEDPAIRVVILTGEGTKAFVAGADIAEMAPLHAREGMIFSEKGHKAISALEKMTKPVIAAVNGYALGGGFELALACDIIYASEKAKVGFPEVTLGILPGFGGTQRTAKLVGLARAKELVLTGKTITAGEAYQMGLINKVVPDEKLMEEVQSLAGQIAANGPVGMRLAKECVNRSFYLDIEAGLELEAKSFGICFDTADQKEGMGAFLEKRKPTYRGE